MTKKIIKKSKTNLTNYIIIIEAIIILLLGISLGVLVGQKPIIVANFEQCVEIIDSEVAELETPNGIERTCILYDEVFFENNVDNYLNKEGEQWPLDIFRNNNKSKTIDRLEIDSEKI